MNFHQWLYLILTVFAAVSSHRAGIMLLAHNLEVKYQAIAADSKPDLLGQLASVLPALLENLVTQQEKTNAQKDSQQSQSGSKESGQASPPGGSAS